MDKLLISPIARGRLGGLTRARRMSARARKASARKAAKARWSGCGKRKVLTTLIREAVKPVV